jgi:hypothetical protein
VSAEGRATIAQWAMRKLGLDAKAADSVAWAISEKIRREGQKPRHILLSRIQRFTVDLKHQVERELRARSQ